MLAKWAALIPAISSQKSNFISENSGVAIGVAATAVAMPGRPLMKEQSVPESLCLITERTVQPHSYSSPLCSLTGITGYPGIGRKAGSLFSGRRPCLGRAFWVESYMVSFSPSPAHAFSPYTPSTGVYLFIFYLS